MLSAADIAFGFPYGPSSNGIRRSYTNGSPLSTLENAITPALERGHCCVSFSGGIDSSLVLAVATATARRIGADDPIPLTWQFAAGAAAYESDWQESIVAALGLADWQRLTPADLDLTGPLATSVLAQHGLMYPANAFLHTPLIDIARGGTLLTGVGGDQILGLWRGRDICDVLAGRRAPRARDPLSAAFRACPRGVRTELGKRLRPGPVQPWLTAPGQRELEVRAAAERFGDPTFWASHLRWRSARRDGQLMIRTLRTLGDAARVPVLSPLFDDGFVASLAAAGGRLGAGDRLATVARFLGPVIPDVARTRRTKALFREVFWREHSLTLAREFAEELSSGSQLDNPFVDPAGLAAEWRSERPSTLTGMLLQQRWLARTRSPEKMQG